MKKLWADTQYKIVQVVGLNRSAGNISVEVNLQCLVLEILHLLSVSCRNVHFVSCKYVAVGAHIQNKALTKDGKYPHMQ